MADDPKQPAKTIIGWLPNGQPPQPSPQSAPAWDSQPRPPHPPAPAQQPPPHGYAPPQNPSYGSAPQGPHGYAQPPQQPGFAQPPQQPGFAQPPQQPGFAQPPQQPGFAQSPQQHGFGAPQGFAPQGSPHGYAQPPQQHGFAQPPQQPGFGAPQGSPHGYAQPPQQPGFGYAPQSYPQVGQMQPPAALGYGASQASGFAAGAGQGGGYSGGHAQAAAAMNESRTSRPIPNASATVGVSDRVTFIRKTYAHLLGAILVFAGLLYLLMTNATLVAKVSIPITEFAFGARWHWGVVLAVFVAVSWIADYWASHATSRAMQYVGLAIYVVAEALIFVPLLAIVALKTSEIVARTGHEPHILRDAAFATLAIFGALTASVFVSKQDFSWLRSGLMMMSAAAMVLIGLSLGFGFNLGIVFSIGMVVLAAGYILYQTSQVLAHYDPRQHVAAALALFSSIALMFWYVIRILLRMRQ